VMRPRPLLCAILLCAVLCPATGALEAEETDRDPRSWELFRRECLTDDSRQDVTLFANGTLRLREGARDDQHMILAELGPDEVSAFVRRIKEEDLVDAWRRDSGLQGIAVESCRLAIDLERADPVVFYYSRFQSRSLTLGRLVALADELVGTAVERTPGESLPRDYIPEPGDILRRGDGVLFQVVAFTSDGKGVEMIGVDQPLLIFVEKGSLYGEFAAVIRKRGPRR
jgi:hypothetical protein